MIKILLGLGILIAFFASIFVLLLLVGIIYIFLSNTFTNWSYSYTMENILNYSTSGFCWLFGIAAIILLAFALGSLAL